MIFTERKITITNNQCKIDSPVVLYRGDYNVEVRFTIVSCPYKYSNTQETNIIENTEASYGQLVIETPSSGTIISEITATKRGAITFTITAEMIDEVTEIGSYTFQIRLLDENKESRATIPEVVNGIEIRKPIATEDDPNTNEVGEAAVGYAVTTAGTTEDTFDSQGNYNKTTWATGDKITDAKLNKIEAGIDGVNKKVASAGEVDLSGYVTKETGNANQITFSDGQTFQAKLDAGTLKGDKGDKGDVGLQGPQGEQGPAGEQGLQGEKGQDGLTTSIKYKEQTCTQVHGKIDLSNVTFYDDSEIKQNITNIQNKLGNYPILNDRLNTVENKFNDMFPVQYTDNLFDKNNVEIGCYYKYDGKKITNDVYCASQLIPISENDLGSTFANTWSGHVTFWDENKQFVSGLQPNFLFTIPNNNSIKYFRTMTKLANLDETMVSKRDTRFDMNSVYVPFKYTFLADDVVPKKVLSELHGKVWNALGDSITASSMSYHRYIAERTNCSVNNYGISGTTIARKNGLSGAMVDRYTNMIDNADIITLFGGTNDYVQRITLGDLNSNDPATFYGALNIIIEGLINKYPTKKIGVFTPMKRLLTSEQEITFAKYVDAVIEVCNKFSIPCLDLYRGCGLNPNIEIHNNTMFNNADGLHPNAEGHKFLSNKIEKFLLSL